MKKYTIHTENKNLKQVKNILNNLLGYVGYTIIEAKGIWKGISENSLKIEIVSNHSLDSVVKVIASEIKHANKQEAVLITVQDVVAELV